MGMPVNALCRVLILITVPCAVIAQGIWVDPSPHVQKFVIVGRDTAVEVLDWGGAGRPLILLSQLGQTAHIYDDWASSFVDSFRVLAITRRGFGASTTTTENYSVERLARDVLAVIEAEQLQHAIVVGHGFAGEEMSWLGVKAADKASGLVYLDAAYDRTNVGAETEIARRIPTKPSEPPDMSSVQSVVAWMSSGLGGRIPEAEVRQLAEVAPDGRVIGERTRSRVGQAVMAQLKPLEPSDIRVPVLAIYAPRTAISTLPGCQRPEEPSVASACKELYEWTTAQLARSKRLFAGVSANVRFIDMPGANSFLFLSHGTEVTDAVKAFASGLADR
jgi:non-heme chloroperoxidase